MRQVLGNRLFLRFWTAGLFVELATWALHTSMLILVFQRTGSPFATGLIPVFASLPGIVLGPLAGVLVDRQDRRRVMLCGALALAGLLVLALPVAGSGQAWPLFAIIAIQATVVTFYAPAENAVLPALVAPDQLVAANSLNALNDSLGRIIGPAIGAVLLVRGGFAALLLLCAALYVVAAAVLVGLGRTEGTPAWRAPIPSRAGDRLPDWLRSVGRDLTSGLGTVRASRVLMVAVAVFGLYMVADVPLSAVLPAFVADSLRVGAGAFGVMMTLRGLTGLLGGLLVAIVEPRFDPAWLLAGGLLLYGCGIATLGIVNDYGVGLWMVIPSGLSEAMIQTGLFTLIQRGAPDAMRGRVFALVGTVNGLITLATSVTAGTLAAAIGTQPVVILSGGLEILPLAVIATLIWRSRALVILRQDQGFRKP